MNRILTALVMGMGLLGMGMVASLSLPVAHAGPKPKVKVCHIPPGNPDNFHTITINQNALPAHLAHDDVEGSCANAGEILCDDGDQCTIDNFAEGTEICLLDQPVNCDDGDDSTRDSCDSAIGCINDPIEQQQPEDVVTAQSQNVTLSDELVGDPPAPAPVTITLVGSSLLILPGESLNFSIEAPGPSNGSLADLAPDDPDDVLQCSETRTSCDDNTDCTGGTDTCELTTPAITTATVEYTPLLPLADDSFDFTVEFNSIEATATVSIFEPGTDDPANTPEIGTIKALHVAAEVIKSGLVDISLKADAPLEAPNAVGDLVFTIITEPTAGSLNTPVDSPDTPVRSATVEYTHTGSDPAEPGDPAATDSFTFQACEVAAPTNCSNATVSITIDFKELAPDQTLQGDVDQPLTFDLAPSQ